MKPNFVSSSGKIRFYNCDCEKFMAECEYAWSSFDKNAQSVSINNTGYKRIHPCQKHVKLYRRILKNYAKAGQRILDTHGGSMSIAIVCHYMGFELDICEKDKEYFDSGIKRFVNETRQLELL